MINSYKMNIQVDKTVFRSLNFFFAFFHLCVAAYQMMSNNNNNSNISRKVSQMPSNISTAITSVLCLIYFQIQANDSKFVFIIHVKRRKWRKNGRLAENRPYRANLCIALQMPKTIPKLPNSFVCCCCCFLQANLSFIFSKPTSQTCALAVLVSILMFPFIYHLIQHLSIM